MYEPSVTVTRVHRSRVLSVLPIIKRNFHIHMQLHYLITSLIFVGIIFSLGGSTSETIVTNASPELNTVHTRPRFAGAYSTLVLVNLFGVLTNLGELEYL